MLEGLSKLSVVICHNWYRSRYPSGENIVVKREIELLKKHNVCCQEYMRYNDELEQASIVKKVFTLLEMTGSRRVIDKLKRELEKFEGSKIFHAHNIFPMFNYDVFVAAKELGFTTVQTLHNYRLIASHKHFYTKNGRIRKPVNTFEQDRLRRMNPYGRGFLECFYDRAYRKVWREDKLNCVDKFICLTEFQRDLLSKFGMPSEKLFVKPNFVSDRGCLFQQEGKYVIFVGRLSSEKGVLPLAKLWRKMDIPLYIVGTGPLRRKLPIANNIHYLDQVDNESLIELIMGARFLVMNSTCYEPFGLVLIEALSCGIPCLVPNLGAMPEIIADGIHGYVFKSGNMNELAEKAKLLWDNATSMKRNCRMEYENKYTPERNIKLLLDAYYENTSLCH
jgi:glycosyltransferase involved in cell wall biosynthesis